MITEAEKEIKGLVEIELNSGKQYIKFTNRANQVIWEKTGSTAGGTAKVEYKDEAGNVLWYYDDAGNFVRNGDAKITGLAGTGTRMVTADASGNLSAGALAYSENTFTPTLSATGQVGS